MMNAGTALYLTKQSCQKEIDQITELIELAARAGRTNVSLKKSMSEGAERHFRDFGYTLYRLGMFWNNINHISW